VLHLLKGQGLTQMQVSGDQLSVRDKLTVNFSAIAASPRIGVPSHVSIEWGRCRRAFVGVRRSASQETVHDQDKDLHARRDLAAARDSHRM
jgi:hypothetical protein